MEQIIPIIGTVDHKRIGYHDHHIAVIAYSSGDGYDVAVMLLGSMVEGWWMRGREKHSR